MAYIIKISRAEVLVQTTTTDDISATCNNVEVKYTILEPINKLVNYSSLTSERKNASLGISEKVLHKNGIK